MELGASINSIRIFRSTCGNAAMAKGSDQPDEMKCARTPRGISESAAKLSSLHRWLDRQIGRSISYRETSDVEEDRLPIALKIDVKSVDYCAASFRPGRYQRSAPFRLLNNIQDRILGICRFLVAKIHTRGEPDIDAARPAKN